MKFDLTKQFKRLQIKRRSLFNIWKSNRRWRSSRCDYLRKSATFRPNIDRCRVRMWRRKSKRLTLERWARSCDPAGVVGAWRRCRRGVGLRRCPSGGRASVERPSAPVALVQYAASAIIGARPECRRPSPSEADVTRVARVSMATSTSPSGAGAVNGPDLSRLPHIRTRYGFTLVYTLLDILQRDAAPFLLFHYYCFSCVLFRWYFLYFFISPPLSKSKWRNEQIEKWGFSFREQKPPTTLNFARRYCCFICCMPPYINCPHFRSGAGKFQPQLQKYRDACIDAE